MSSEVGTQFETLRLLSNALAPAASGAVSPVVDFRPYERIESIWTRGSSVLGAVSYNIYFIPGITSVGQFNNPSVRLLDEDRFVTFANLDQPNYLVNPEDITTEAGWLEIIPNFSIRSPFGYFLIGVTGGSATDQRIDLFAYMRKR